ncbi:hypothetical protein ASPVEDRAFT_32124 [Aspergillus versicolor CBS 583.65]|uniref:Uncharacterized protein n=1 Tax=Aspergillus versicolor CBS 583.65 TaxID=1036611 RepID=A0A1L9PW69_ASPVE|nr:uncharacterized protein ASPVEDRAFT_32124 [Aspergillus versicolor CBS 583.65]OJJ05768.1 hypothetical protein ASPVEDRAFT_32124 [Aspergillus versicolor CBS 583.65]
MRSIRSSPKPPRGKTVMLNSRGRRRKLQCLSCCRFALKPIEASPDGKQLRVQFFRWNYVPLNLPGPPEEPDSTGISACSTQLDNIEIGQRIQWDDIIIFTTTDPEKLPLPSIGLLDMQWALHRLNALSGAADATDADLNWNDTIGLGPLDDVGKYDVGIYVDQPEEGEWSTFDEWEQLEAPRARPLALRLRNSSTRVAKLGRLMNHEL